MILNISNAEAATLTLHMSIMRKNFKKLLKRKYKEHQSYYLQSYNYVVQEAVYVLENELESYQVHLNIVDLEVLSEFLHAYVAKTEEEVKKALKPGQEDPLQALKDLCKQCKEQLADVS